MNWQEELAKVRTGVQAEVFKQEECPAYTPADGGILGKIQHFAMDSPVPGIALGPLGSKLCAFARAIDRSHPDIAEFVGGAFMPGHEFCETADQLLQASQLCHEAGLMRVFPNFAKMAAKLAVYEDLVQQIDNPAIVLNHLRFIPLRADRDELRTKQRTNNVNLDRIVQQGPVIWDPLPSSFGSYVRNKHPYGEDIERCKLKANYLLETGCPEMASKITSRIQSFEDQMKDRYYGFNRVTITNASVICAKILKCELTLGSYGKTHRIVLSPEFLQVVKDKASVSLTGSTKAPTVSYEPRIYPIHMFKDVVSADVSKVIDHLETFPATGGRPIFDHFWVLVPSVNIAHIPTADVVKEKILTEGAFKFDVKLVETKSVLPVLLGEKDGKMYFLDYMD
jgi:hypothetical protein